jgi:hypothetical protein
MRTGMRLMLLGLTVVIGACATNVDTATQPDEPATATPATAGDTTSSATLVRLTNREYDNAIQELLGVPGLADATFPTDQVDFEKYFEAADALGEQVWSNPFLKSRLLACMPSEDMACTRQLVTTIGSRAYHGPMAPSEVDRLTKVATDAVAIGETPADSIKQVVKTVLASPQFLYQVTPTQQL